MDPVSFAASLVTLLGLAGAATESVYNFILDIQGAPEEIRIQAIKLQCLHTTIATLIARYGPSVTNLPLRLDPLLEEQLQIFLFEIQALESKLKESSSTLLGSRKQRVWERMTWLSSDRRLRKFYASLDDWMRIFSAALSATQLDLLVQIAEQTSPVQTIASILHTQQQQSMSVRHIQQQPPLQARMQQEVENTIPAPKRRATLPLALRAYLSQRRDLVGLTTQFSYKYRAEAVVAYFRAGPAIMKNWSQDGRSIRSILSWKQGACVILTVRLRWLTTRRVDIVLGYVLEWPKLSFNFSLKPCGTLRRSHPVYAACRDGDWPALRQMLEQKQASIFDKTEFYGHSLLHRAVEGGYFDMVLGLLQHGAKVDAEDDQGRTPLHYTTMCNSGYRIANLLLLHGADLCHQNTMGGTPLHYAFQETSRAVLEFYQDDVDFDSRDLRGMTTAYYICWSRSSLPSELSRCHGNDDTYLARTDNIGRTILHFACWAGNVEMVKFLLQQNNAQLSHPDRTGRSMMHHAALDRSASVIDVLVQHGFDIHAVDNRGNTVLHDAVLSGSEIVAEKLISLGVESDLEVVNIDGRTPFELALAMRNNGMADLLLVHFPHLRDQKASETSSIVSFDHTLYANNREETTLSVELGQSSKPLWSNSEVVLKSLGAYMLFWLVLQLWTLLRSIRQGIDA